MTETRLHCVGDEVVSAEMLEHWRCFQKLPDKARDDFWEVLTPSLSAMPKHIGERLDAYCRLYDIDPRNLEPALKVCRFLVSQASSLNLSRDELAEDLAKLSGSDDRGVEVLLSGYEAAKATTRNDILRRTVFDHGSVLVGVDWRVDRVTASARGLELDTPIALLTLHVREGGSERRTTLYATADVLSALGRACTRLAAHLRPAGYVVQRPSEPEKS